MLRAKMPRLRLRMTGALTCLLLGACALPLYKEPTGVPTARLRNLSQMWGANGFYNMGSECNSAQTLVSGMNGKGMPPLRNLGIPGAPGDGGGTADEVLIAGDKPYYGSAYAVIGSPSTGGRQCGPIHFTFSPEAGADYELRFMPGARGTSSGCRLELVRLEVHLGQVIRASEPSFRRFTCQMFGS